jgi:YD repeat-containing protein
VRAGRWRGIGCPADYEYRPKPGGAPGEIECWKIRSPTCEGNGKEANGANSGADSVGNPIRLADCNKIQQEVDISTIGSGGLRFVRTFASGSYFEPVAGTEGAWSYWHHTYARRIIALTGNNAAMAVAQRETGELVYFSASGSELLNAEGGAARLQRLPDVWNTHGVAIHHAGARRRGLQRGGPASKHHHANGLVQILAYSDASTPSSIAPAAGLLIGVSDTFGRSLRFTYDGAARLNSVSDPAGNLYTYLYDSGGRLTQITYPDLKQRAYVYENATFPFLLTGIIDENGKTVCHLQLRPIGTRSKYTTRRWRRTLYVERVDVGLRAYRHRHRFAGYPVHQRLQGCRRSVEALAALLQQLRNLDAGDFTFDANGNRASYIDLNRTRTNYTFDLTRNLETVRVEGLTAAGGITLATRTITTEWHPAYRLPTRIAEPTRISVHTYDNAGNLRTKSIQETGDANGEPGLQRCDAGRCADMDV